MCVVGFDRDAHRPNPVLMMVIQMPVHGDHSLAELVSSERFETRYPVPVCWQVVVADSNSPVKPQFVHSDEQAERYPKLQWVELSKNFGHEAVSSAPTIGGWERSVLQGAFQAILNDVDYFIYVEQDLLVRVRPCACRALLG